MNQNNYNQILQNTSLSNEQKYVTEDVQFGEQFQDTLISFKMDNKSQLSQANTQNNLSKRQSRRSDQDKKMSTIRNIYADSKGNQKLKKKKSQNKRRQITSRQKQFNSSQLIKVFPLGSNESEKQGQSQVKFNHKKPVALQDMYYKVEQSNIRTSKRQDYELEQRPKRETTKEDQANQTTNLTFSNLRKSVRDDAQKYQKEKQKSKVDQKQQEKQKQIKAIREIREREEKFQKTQYEYVEKLLKRNSMINTKKEEKKINAERTKEIEAAKQILSGKVSIIWIFVIGGQIQQDDKNRILQMYNGLSSGKYIAPLCKAGIQIKPFLEIPNSLFKVVSDLQNIEDSLRYKINKAVVEYYVYNEKGEKGVSQALQFKSESRKVKGIYTKLDKIISRAEDELQNEVYLFQTKNGISKRKHTKFFPSFLKLSGQDKSEATSYRSNLFGSKNLPTEEKKEKYEDFMMLVKSKYGDSDKQKENIKDYSKIDHKKHIQNLEQARKIIEFYVRQSFYYQILNSLLRTMKTTQQFRPCVLPFNETYHSIKCFYKLNKGVVKKKTLYRGAKIRKRDLQGLKPNVYIQMFGFMSTSKNFERAKEFTGDSGHMFIIDVPERTIPKKYEAYDHGFVDINQHNLASQKFKVEEEILFNALNVFKVKDITQDEEGRTLIRIEYGVIFDLLAKKKSELTQDERDVLVNYQYCIEMLSGIQDQGDVHLLANQFQESKNYYENKLEQNTNNEGKILYKLANVQQKSGQLQDAEKNAKKSLQIQKKDLDINDREKCLKVFSIHSKNAQICLQKQDYLEADDALTGAIEMLGEDNEFEKAKKIRERGEIKFKKGEIINAENDFVKSQNLFKHISKKGEEKRKKIKQHYFWTFLTFCCQSQSLEQMEEQKQEELKEIEELEMQIAEMKDSINDELIKVNGSMKDVAEYAQDKEKYEICVKKARSYLLEIQARKTNDPREKAKLKALEATVQDYLELAESEKLLNEAISLVESTDPYNEDVGKFSSILGKLQKEHAQKYTNPKCMMKAKLKKGLEPIPYNGKEHKQVYNKCKSNFQKAINILLFNNKTHNSPQVLNLKNQLGQLDYNENNYESSYKIIKEIRDSNPENNNSQVSKSCLLLSKIAYSRGELKNSFGNIEEAKEVLKKSIVKKEEDKYYKVYHANDIYLQIKLHKAKIYLKQLRHDLSLKEVEKVKKYLNIKLQEQQYHSFLPDAYQIQAQNLGTSQQIYDFDKYFQKAIKLRQKQIGEYNLANAVAYCNYAKFLILYHDYKHAQEALQKAFEIFSCFSSDHPITWLVLYVYGVFKSANDMKEESLVDFQKCINMALKKFDRSHITMSKIRYQYAKELQKSKKFDNALKEYENLEQDLSQNIRESQIRYKIEEQKDDEKITVKKLLYTSVQNYYKEIQNLEESKTELNNLRLTNYEKKFSELKATYKIKK